MTKITKRQDKILATIERVEARIEKLESMTDDQISKKYADKHWYVVTIALAKEQLQDNMKKLEEAKRLDAKEEEKLQKQQSKENTKSSMPKVLKDFEDSLREHLEKSWLEHWEHYRSLPYPRFSDRSEKANEIRRAKNQSKSEIVKDAKDTAESLVLNLFNRVSKKCGVITSAKNLFINDGNWLEGSAINGTVIGDKGTATVTSILAGGYNIQRLHVRVLVK